MNPVNRQLKKSAGDSAPVISSTAPSGSNQAVAPPACPLVTRDGAVTIRDLIDHYMSEYTGRDTTRVQRLAFWSTKLGKVALSGLDDDQIFRALNDLAATGGLTCLGFSVRS